MGKIAWVTDSTAFLTEDLKNHPDVYTVPISILLDEKEYSEEDLTPEQLYEKLKTLNSPPKTSQPPVGVFKNLYSQLEKKYDAVISILISSKLSGTVSTSEQASQLVNIPVLTIDSKILSYPITVLIKKGMEWAAEGRSISEINEKICTLRDSNEAYVLVGSLEQLHRSGRMGGVQYYLGSMLNIKPIIQIIDGALSVKDKVRSEKRAKSKILQYLKQSYEKFQLKEIYILYGLHASHAHTWKKEILEHFPKLKIDCYPLGATIGVHAGENTLGISWYNELKER